MVEPYFCLSKMFFNRLPLIGLFLSFSLLRTTVFAVSRLPQDEVDALNEVARKMGATNWTFTADSCGEYLGSEAYTDNERNTTCSCTFENNTCHVTNLVFKRFSLPGVLPPELSRLRYLESIDFAYNCLSGSIPREWVSMQLKSISLLANRLSGNIPSYLENFTSLTYLSLELNQFSGTIPPEIGKLVNLRRLHLSSNNLSGDLPIKLSELNLTDFRINDNNLNGIIPDFIQNWTQLSRLEIQASGLQGPIPSSISRFENLRELRISDIDSMDQEFPDLRKSTGLRRLVLRKCNITGEIPPYIWVLSTIRTLDLSFNNLHGPIPSEPPSRDLVFIFLTGNSLSGNIPSLRVGVNVDLSYNNFTRQTEQRGCQQKENLNLFRSSSMGKDIRGACAENFNCQRYSHSLYINCGGRNVKIDGKDYKGDDGAHDDAATFYTSDDGWGFSSTGDFMDNNDDSNKPYTVNSTSADLGELYRTARMSPLSLTYYHQCLRNLNYSVTLHFAEIEFRNDGTYYSFGRRIFDIYIQDHLIEKDFNIEYEASGAMKPIPKRYNASVTNGTLDIRFYWAGKGTTRIPDVGFYGPLISAISVDPLDYNPPSEGGSTNIAAIIGGALGFCLLLLGLSFLWWRRRSRDMNTVRKDFEGSEFQTVSFTLKQIKAATNNFDSANKIGEGGFGPVYKGLLADGTVVAVKQLSSKSSQGNREFLNEIGMISCLQHPNLVKLHGCCIEGDQLLLVYEYMENNCLAHALFEPEKSHLKLDWKTRQSICLGVAKGLTFLHEESRLKIVHRDIKATNVLLDKDLKPKISDFGLAKLDDNDKTHISTRVAGTIGYMAPEYALWGYLTDKADVYSFGVVALEIVSGKHNTSYGLENNFACLLDWACHLQQRGELQEIVDKNLSTEFNVVEAERMVKVALLCTNGSPTLRPIMSDVVRMLEGINAIPDEIPEADNYNHDLRFKAIREHRKILNSRNSQGSLRSDKSSSVSAKDLYSINNVEEYTRNESWTDHSKNFESRSASTSFPSANVSSSMSSHDLYEISLSSQ